MESFAFLINPSQRKDKYKEGEGLRVKDSLVGQLRGEKNGNNPLWIEIGRTNLFLFLIT